jgi:hypothetical protein
MANQMVEPFFLIFLRFICFQNLTHMWWSCFCYNTCMMTFQVFVLNCLCKDSLPCSFIWASRYPSLWIIQKYTGVFSVDSFQASLKDVRTLLEQETAFTGIKFELLKWILKCCWEVQYRNHRTSNNWWQTFLSVGVIGKAAMDWKGWNM